MSVGYVGFFAKKRIGGYGKKKTQKKWSMSEIKTLQTLHYPTLPTQSISETIKNESVKKHQTIMV